jgi:ClpP class serine protease
MTLAAEQDSQRGAQTENKLGATPGYGWTYHAANGVRSAFWFFLTLVFILQALQPYWTSAARTQVLKRFQEERNAQVIAMIHHQDTVSLLGVPVSRSISIEDSEAVLRAIRNTPADQPIDMILHTPGGLVLAAEQIAKALVEHKGKVTVFVPHYAMSGGTLIALAADEIVMDPSAVLGPVDPQIGPVPAASVLKVLEAKKPEQVNDLTLVLADVARKARTQVTSFVEELLLKHFTTEKAAKLAETLSEGRWTHDYPITVQGARELGIKVSTDMPRTVYTVMDLYPQGAGERPSVFYVPMRKGIGKDRESLGTSP